MTTAHQQDRHSDARMKALDYETADSQLAAAAAHPTLADASRYVEDLGSRLCDSRSDDDIKQISGRLFAITERIRSNGSSTATDYRDILQGLTDVYARGIAHRGLNPCTRTATVYAELVSAISQSFQDYDYSDALGQLVVYMARLFRARESGWATIYRHIQSMPENLAARQQLNQALFKELQEWFESGAGNLFSIRDGLTNTAADLTNEAKTLDARIRYLEDADSTDTGGSDPRVVPLNAVRNARRIQKLKLDLDIVLEERATKEALIELIDDDIRDFENRLIDVRRAYTIHEVPCERKSSIESVSAGHRNFTYTSRGHV